MNLLSSQVMAIPAHGGPAAGNVITGRFPRFARAEPRIEPRFERIDPTLPRKAKIRIRGPCFLTYNLDKVGGRVSGAPASKGRLEAAIEPVSAEGTVIADRYELVSQVGVGGMGVVWRARDRKLGRAVAVKVLSSVSLGNDIARTRLIREARAAAVLEHEGIIRVYDVGETPDGGAFLVMELIRGRSLRAVIEERTAKLGTIAHAIVKAARALQFAHDAGIVHRDMKPDNIMIREDGRVIVVDFGVAKPIATADIAAVAGTVVSTQADGSLTGSGVLVGTPAYLAPEQARGQPVGPATDQFALAVTAYEALTGGRPWAGSCFSEVIASLLRDAPPPVSSIVEVPKSIDEILARAMAKEPSARWERIGDFADAMEDAAQVLDADPVPSSRALGRRITPTEPAKPVPTPTATPNATSNATPTDQAQPSPPEPLIRTGDDAPPSVTAPESAEKPSRRKPLILAAAVAVVALVSWRFVASSANPGVQDTAASAASAAASKEVRAASHEPPPAVSPATTPSSSPTVVETAIAVPTASAIPTASVASTSSSETIVRRPSTATPSATRQPQVRASVSAKPVASVAPPASTPSSTGRRIRTDL